MCVMPENCVHIQNNKETTTGCGNVKHFATEEPTMPFFLSNSQQSLCHTVMRSYAILSYLFARCHQCDRINTVLGPLDTALQKCPR